MRLYCTQNKGRCWSCPLSKNGQDCHGSLAMWWDIDQASAVWGISKRRVTRLLSEGYLPGAELIADDKVYHWRIPIDTPCPDAHGYNTILKYT